MNDTVFSLNGKIVTAEEAVVPVTDRGFLYGDGVFETLHAYGRKLFRLREHLQRLAHGAEQLFFTPRPDLRRLGQWLREAVSAADFQEASARLTLTRGAGPRGPSISGQLKPNAVIIVTRFTRTCGDRQPISKQPASLGRLPAGGFSPRGAAAVLASFRRQESAVTASLKTLNYLEQILAKREADAAGADEALLLNNAGLLSEGSSSNLAIIRGASVLEFPDPERSGALPGIAQLTALEAARRLKIPALRTLLSPWDLYGADEAFLSGSMREITPLVRVAGRPIGCGKPGPVTLRLIAEYRRIVERECAPFKY
jgi:branched-chain amino acid aminotransferase